MALIEIGPGKEDTGHQHPFEQCGVVTEGEIEMFVGDDRQVSSPWTPISSLPALCTGGKRSTALSRFSTSPSNKSDWERPDTKK